MELLKYMPLRPFKAISFKISWRKASIEIKREKRKNSKRKISKKRGQRSLLSDY
jgi:hypothetical protein